MLDRLASNFGPPWDRDEAGLTQMQHDWALVLAGCSEAELHAAALEWMTTNDTWPKAANIRKLVRDARPAPPPRYHQAGRSVPPPTPEELARVSAAVAALKVRLHAADREASPQVHRRKVALEGASPEFLALLQEDP